MALSTTVSRFLLVSVLWAAVCGGVGVWAIATLVAEAYPPMPEPGPVELGDVSRLREPDPPARGEPVVLDPQRWSDHLVFRFPILDADGGLAISSDVRVLVFLPPGVHEPRSLPAVVEVDLDPLDLDDPASFTSRGVAVVGTQLLLRGQERWQEPAWPGSEAVVAVLRALAVIARRVPEIDPDRLVLLGRGDHSAGAALAAAAHLPGRFRGLALHSLVPEGCWSPGFPFPWAAELTHRREGVSKDADHGRWCSQLRPLGWAAHVPPTTRVVAVDYPAAGGRDVAAAERFASAVADAGREVELLVVPREQALDPWTFDRVVRPGLAAWALEVTAVTTN
ncbi:MAG: hypothetical protein H6732_19520 [Alphaproteobacteria bacterium]|nr:hypothetical protein [Alphaproteobacteria bacterium]